MGPESNSSMTYGVVTRPSRKPNRNLWNCMDASVADLLELSIGYTQ